MRKIAIAAAVSLSLSGVTGVSHALGLGEIEMYSALNQTLDAEIAILSASEDELQSMQVKLASASAFARAGLEQSPVLASVVFDVDRRPDGEAVVKVTSDSPVLEPFLNFLIEVESPGSVKLVREYTVLLNPPTFAESGSNSDDQLLKTNNTSDVYANSTSDGTGVQIDLADSPIPNAYPGNDSEVSFTESVAAVASDSLFVPDAQILDADGEIISLEQDFNTTPQFEPAIEPASTGESISLDNLGAQGSDNAIFSDEFDAQGGELISRDTLQSEAGDAQPVVEYEVADLSITDSQTFDTSDSDAQAAGDLIDLSGIIVDDSSTFVEEVVTTTQPTSQAPNAITLDGIEVEIDDLAQDGVVQSGAVSNQSVEITGNTYRVRSQDTLWSVANAQKARGVTPHQMMVSLLDANPSAFVGGNMNRLISGAVLQIPTESSQTSVDAASAFAIVQSWTRNNRSPSNISTGSVANIIQPVTVVEDNDVYVSDSATTTFSTDLNRNLDEVNQRYEEVQSEIMTETAERDVLQGRVNNLTDNMEEMKSLITVRENELNQLQDEVSAAESSAAEIDAQISQLSNASEGVATMQENLSADLTEAQDAIAEQADVAKNMATAEAEAQSVRLSSEEDALRAQIAALQIEKADLEAASELERASLVREAEAEKNRLLAEAKTERENIMAELDAEKVRISQEAEVEIARIQGEADVENRRLATAARADTEDMQAKLAEMEAEKMRLLEEARVKSEQVQAEAANLAESSDSSGIKDTMADLKEGAEDKMASATDSMTGDTDAEGAVDGAVSTISNAGKSMAAGGAAAVGGLLGFAPLQEMVGNRKTVLAAGAGLSLLGLLGAWGVRRSKKPKPEGRNLRPRADGRGAPEGRGRPAGRSRADSRPVPPPQARSRHEQEEAMYGDSKDAAKAQPQQRSSSSGAAAAAAAAAAVTGTAAVATSRKAEAPTSPETSAPTAAPAPEAAVPDSPAPVEKAATEASVPAPDATVETSKATDAVQADAPAAPKAAEVKSVEPDDETALDDTITEAEVYMRYGLHGQAEDLLKTAIDRSPNNEEYQFKLLENYHDQKNSSDFNSAAEAFKGKFPNSEHLARITEMDGELSGSGGSAGILGAAGAAAAGAAALGAGAVGSAKDAAADGLGSLTGSADSDLSADADMLDQTIDPGLEFSVDELQATGNLSSLVDDDTDFGDAGSLSLDDVDLASLDDDGTMNLEDIAGSQMSGGDLGTLDLTNPDMDGALEDLKFDDTDLTGAAGGIGGGIAGAAGSLGQNFDADPVGSVPGGSDEMETMLDLAKAYIDMGDSDNASKALKDIAARGNPLQQTEASELLKKLK